MPLKKLIKELFTLPDSDKQNSTNVLEKLNVIGIQELLDDLEEEKKATYKYLSISVSEFLWEHYPPDVKKAMLGKMASNNLSEISFKVVTAQVKYYARIDMCRASAVSDTVNNGFLDCTTSKKQMEGNQQRLFHRLTDELQITIVMVAMEDAPEKRR